MNKIYSKISELPHGDASQTVTPGCIILEGGAFRGLYTGGVLDCLMEHDINMQCTIGVSAGSMNGYSYVAGQLGRPSRFNLSHRHDSRYVGLRALRKNKGIFGFDLVFDDARNGEPLNHERLMDPARRFIAVATNCGTGRPVYLEKGVCSDIFQAIRASASMPLFSKMVPLDGGLYLDGGCSENIPLQWALDQGFEKIIIVRTRNRDYRKKAGSRMETLVSKLLYHRYPQFLHTFLNNAAHYNETCDRIDALEQSGRVFVLAPVERVTVSRLEKDMEKLGALYHAGYDDTQTRIDDLKAYLS